MNATLNTESTNATAKTDAGPGLGKWTQTVQSRKVWAGLLALAVTLLLRQLGEIDGPQTVEAVTWIVGIFMGAVALEDGLRNVFSTLARLPAPPVGPEAKHANEDTDEF